MPQDIYSNYKQILNSLGVPVTFLNTDYANISQVDHQLRERLGFSHSYTRFIEVLQKKASSQALLKCKDSFQLYYYFFRTADFSADGQAFFCIGPILRQEVTDEELLGILTAHRLPFHMKLDFYSYYNHVSVQENLPVFEKTLLAITSSIFSQNMSLNTLPEKALRVSLPDHLTENNIPVHIDDTIENMYKYENLIMDAVTRGDAASAIQYWYTQAQITFPPRHFAQNPLRSAKNRMIVFNVLMRKAIEKGGVHPIYLDDISSKFATRIEASTSAAELSDNLGCEMIQEYCKLVNSKVNNKYHPLIQDCILYIEQNYYRELNLTALADAHYVSRQYLSSLFKKETGINITDYIQECRMRHALDLLDNSTLTISQIAEKCGYENTAYFAKIFRKYHNVSPRDYRKNQED